MPTNNMSTTSKNKNIWVRETGFGRWFLSTNVWYKYVLSQAFIDLKNLLNGRTPEKARVLDAGCGQGMAFSLIETHFQPATITGIDIDADQIKKAQLTASQITTSTSAFHANASDLTFSDNSFDIILCHQLLHHTSQQTETLQEFYRLLEPGGILLVGESCRSFIQSAPVRLLFRHPHMAQKNAQGYIDLLHNAGFIFTESDIQTSRPWWSRRCLGLAQKIGLGLNITEPTEILIVATKSK